MMATRLTTTQRVLDGEHKRDRKAQFAALQGGQPQRRDPRFGVETGAAGVHDLLRRANPDPMKPATITYTDGRTLPGAELLKVFAVWAEVVEVGCGRPGAAWLLHFHAARGLFVSKPGTDGAASAVARPDLGQTVRERLQASAAVMAIGYALGYPAARQLCRAIAGQRD
jgi:hypothetical protein